MKDRLTEGHYHMSKRLFTKKIPNLWLIIDFVVVTIFIYRFLSDILQK